MLPYRLLALLIGSAVLLAFSGCKKDEGHSTEFHSVRFSCITRSEPHGYYPMEYIDPFAGHGNNYDTLQGLLPNGRIFDGELLLWKKVPDPPSSYSGYAIHNELLEEAKTHQIFYEVSDSLDLSITYADTDANGKPIGLATLVTTGQPSSGQLTITVIHEPDKNGENVSNGDITNAKGTVDFTFIFDVVIE